MPHAELQSSDRGAGMEEFVCIGILCFFGVAGAIPGIAPNQAAEMTGFASSGLTTIVGVGSQVLVDGSIALLLLRALPRLCALGRTMQWSAALAMFSLLSVAWSQEPMLTARRAVPFALSAVFGLYLAARFSAEKQLSLLRMAFALLAIGTAITAIGFPRIGLDASTGHFGNWQGVFTQKNACGRAMVFASAAVLSAPLNLRRALTLCLFVGVLVMSGSRGAWVIEALLFGAILFLHLLRTFDRPLRAWLAAAAGAAAVGALVLGKAVFPLLAALAGRDPTLTGRTAIWAQVWLAILHRPWLGYGFSAFWRGWKGASFDVIVALKFVLFHAHNGFLELWLELGAVGLLLFALSYARAWYRLWPTIRDGNLRHAAWPASILLLIAAYNVDENTLLSFNGLYWVLYVNALVQIELMAAPVTARAASHSLKPRLFNHGFTTSRPLAPTGAAWL